MIINYINRIANLLHLSADDAIAYCEEVRRASGLGKQLSDATIARHLLVEKPPYPKASILAASIQQQMKGRGYAIARSLQFSEPAEMKQPVETNSRSLEASVGEFTSCPICTARVKTTRLNKHLRKVHPNNGSPYQSPRAQKGKRLLLNDNTGQQESKSTENTKPTRSSPVNGLLLEQGKGHQRNRGTVKPKMRKPERAKRARLTTSRRWNISKAVHSERRFQNEGFGKPTPLPSYMVRKSYFDHTRVAEEKLEHCPHGVPRSRVCAICDPDKFREMTGID